MTAPAWMDDAACRLFYPDQGAWDQARAAVAACQDCPVRRSCLDHALTHGGAWGVWGGTTPHQRIRMPGWDGGWQQRQRRHAHVARVTALTAAGWNDREIAAETGSTKQAVDRFRARHGITAGRTT